MTANIPSARISLLPEDPRKRRVRADEPPMSHRAPRLRPDFWCFGLRRDQRGKASAILWISRPEGH